jgi:hypothetical protein
MRLRAPRSCDISLQLETHKEEVRKVPVDLGKPLVELEILHMHQSEAGRLRVVRSLVEMDIRIEEDNCQQVEKDIQAERDILLGEDILLEEDILLGEDSQPVEDIQPAKDIQLGEDIQDSTFQVLLSPLSSQFQFIKWPRFEIQ